MSDEFHKGDRVHVKAGATYAIGRAAKAAKKSFLVGVVKTEEDPCCGCYVVEFTKRLGTESTYGGVGMRGYCDEVDPEHMKKVGKAKAKADEGLKVGVPLSKQFPLGSFVEVVDNRNGYSGVKKGEVGVVKHNDGPNIGVEWLKAGESKHSLGGLAREDHGYWVPPTMITPIPRPTGYFAPFESVLVEFDRPLKTQDGHAAGKGTRWSGFAIPANKTGDKFIIAVPFGKDHGLDQTFYFQTDDPRITVTTRG